jgi:hypothetical protein
MPTTPAGGRQIDRCRELRVLDKRAIILAFRRNNCYFVQVGRQIPAPEGVEKRSLRAVKIEVGG